MTIEHPLPRYLVAGGATLHVGDALRVFAADELGYEHGLGYGPRLLPDASIDSIVTDPPYGIAFMGKAWDQPDGYGSKRKVGRSGVHRRGADRDPETLGDSGAMEAGRYDLSPHAMHAFERWVEAWAAECYRVLKPGGYLVAFGGSRTWHRLASGIEDAGFEIRDSIAWLYAQGFPKSRDMSEQMASFIANGPQTPPSRVIAEEVYTVTRFLRDARERAGVSNRDLDALFGTNGMAGHWTSVGQQPSVPSPRQWAVLREFLGFDDSDGIAELAERLGSTERPEDWGEREQAFLETLGRDGTAAGPQSWGTALKPSFEPMVVARKPFEGTTADNVIQYGTGAYNLDGCRVPMSDEDRETIESMGGFGRAGWEGSGSPTYNTNDAENPMPHQDARTAPGGRWPTNVVMDETIAGELDRQAPRTGAAAPASGPTLVGATDASAAYGARKGLDRPPIFHGDARTGASRMFPVFKFQPKAPSRERPKVGGVQHPTVKPVDLMRWIVRLVTPPGGTVLDLFAGSGTTGEAALVEGFDVVLIEREADYVPLIERRIRRDIQPTMFGDLFDDETEAIA